MGKHVHRNFNLRNEKVQIFTKEFLSDYASKILFLPRDAEDRQRYLTQNFGTRRV